MSKTYFNFKIKNRKKQPLLGRSRVRYRSSRLSEKENLETNLLKIDITRILNELNSVDQKILTDLEYFIGDKADLTTEAMLEDGLSHKVDGVQVYIDSPSAQLEDLYLDSVDKISSRLSRIKNKIERLEKE